MKLNGEIKHFAFLLNSFANVLQLEIWLNVQKGLHIVQKGRPVEV